MGHIIFGLILGAGVALLSQPKGMRAAAHVR